MSSTDHPSFAALALAERVIEAIEARGKNVYEDELRAMAAELPSLLWSWAKLDSAEVDQLGREIAEAVSTPQAKEAFGDWWNWHLMTRLPGFMLLAAARHAPERPEIPFSISIERRPYGDGRPDHPTSQWLPTLGPEIGPTSPWTSNELRDMAASAFEALAEGFIWIGTADGSLHDADKILSRFDRELARGRRPLDQPNMHLTRFLPLSIWMALARTMRSVVDRRELAACCGPSPRSAAADGRVRI